MSIRPLKELTRSVICEVALSHRGAATANSRGRQPTDKGENGHVSREAAAADTIAVAASRLGLLYHVFCGLTPAAICCRRFATQNCAISKSVSEKSIFAVVAEMPSFTCPVTRIRGVQRTAGVSVLLLLLTTACVAGSAAQAQEGTRIAAGSHIALERIWPDIRKAPKSDIGTIEFLIRPDKDAIERPRSFIITLSNNGGSDVSGLSLTIGQGVIVANVFGTRLRSKPIRPDEWAHVALTVNTRTVNKRARLWIDGELAEESLVLEYWPTSFEVTRMLSDKWNQGRVFSGELGDVRISKTVRYSVPFRPPSSLPKDKSTTMRLDGSRLPLQ